MLRIRLTIKRNAGDPADDLRYAARVRTDLWAHSAVEVDPDSRVHGTHRDADPCPNCGEEEVPRQEYDKVSGDLFQCPRCLQHVRLRINPQVWRIDGTLNEPVVMTENGQVFFSFNGFRDGTLPHGPAAVVRDCHAVGGAVERTGSITGTSGEKRVRLRP